MSVSLLKKGMDRLYMSVIDVDPEFADDILMNRTDERMVRELQYTKRRLGVRQQKIKLGPCCLLSTLFNPPPTSLKRDFDSMRKSNQIIRSNSVPQPVVSIQFVDDGDVSEMFEDHREVQIDEYETDSDDEDTENEEHLELVKRACITRFGTELFVHLCVSTCDSK